MCAAILTTAAIDATVTECVFMARLDQPESSWIKRLDALRDAATYNAAVRCTLSDLVSIYSSRLIFFLSDDAQ